MDLAADWVVGFVDGEGCFRVSLNPSDETPVGYEVLPEFVVFQHERDTQILHALKRFFGAGVIRRESEETACLQIRKLECLRKVCEFFAKRPLKTKKNVDCFKFRRILRLMTEKRHLEKDGLVEIVEIALAMNAVETTALEMVKRDLVAG